MANYTSNKDRLEQEFKNFTKKAIGILGPVAPDVDFETIPGWGDKGNEGPPSANFAVFMMSLIFAIFWITYITFFNSRVVGSLVTRIANSKLIQRLIGVSGGYIRVNAMFYFILKDKILMQYIFIWIWILVTSVYILRLVLCHGLCYRAK